MPGDLDKIDQLLADQEKSIRDAFIAFLAASNSATVSAEILRLLEHRDFEAALAIIDSYVERMADVIQQRYTQYIKGERPLAVGHDGRFDRSVQADRLVRYLETQVIRAERRLDYVASV